jgi:membrane associated rhomboid family serine protease
VVRPVLLVLAAMWTLELVDAILPAELDLLGIRGRSLDGLVGVPLAPLLHSGFDHLLANTWPFLVLGTLVAWRSRDRFWAVLAVVTLLSGLGVWLLTSPATVTIGASGVVFGFAAYLVTAGVLTRHWVDVLVALVVVAVYGGLFVGVLPFAVEAQVSWLAHLLGAGAGVVAAVWFARRPGTALA